MTLLVEKFTVFNNQFSIHAINKFQFQTNLKKKDQAKVGN